MRNYRSLLVEQTQAVLTRAAVSRIFFAETDAAEATVIPFDSDQAQDSHQLRLLD